MSKTDVTLSIAPRYCPSCGSGSIRRSHRDGIGDFLAVVILLRPYRCRVCWVRHYGLFFRKRLPKAAATEPEFLLGKVRWSTPATAKLHLSCAGFRLLSYHLHQTPDGGVCAHNAA